MSTPPAVLSPDDAKIVAEITGHDVADVPALWSSTPPNLRAVVWEQAEARRAPAITAAVTPQPKSHGMDLELAAAKLGGARPGAPAAKRNRASVRNGVPAPAHVPQQRPASTAAKLTVAEWRAAVPEEMRRLPRWVGWKHKVPRHPVRDTNASAGVPATWGTFDEAAEYYAWTLADPDAGAGFEFHGDGLVGIDLDLALDQAGEPYPWAAALLEPFLDLGGAYAEVSPSGRGLHLVCRADLPTNPGRVDFGGIVEGKKRSGVEVYRDRRYFTVTGQVWRGQAGLGDAGELVRGLLEATGLDEKARAREAPAERKGTEPHREPEVRSALARIDPDIGYEEWIDVGMALQDGLGTPGFKLWDDWSSLGSKYAGRGDLLPHWRSFEPGGGVGLGTLFEYAKRAGWTGLSAEEEFGAAPAADAPLGDPRRDALESLNADWFVLDEAGKLFVCRFVEDTFGQGQSRKRLDHYTFADFIRRHERVKLSEGRRTTTLGQAWIDWPGRRQFDRVVFNPSPEARRDPAVLNLWSGFAVQPAPGDWSVIRRHVEEVIAGGNAAYATYVLDWIAQMLQSPADPGQVALVLRGKEGVGKSVLGLAVRRILGPHGLAVSNARHVTGRFNAHLRDLVLLQGDEAFFAGDRAQAALLKALITDDMLVIERKGVDAIAAPNHLHLMLTTNEAWAVPAGPQSRRFCVLDVADSRRRDRRYFAELFEAVRDDGVIAAMAWDLLHRDLTGFDVRDFPVTDALREQRAQSLTGVLAWAVDLAERGHLVASEGGFVAAWRPFLTTEELFEDFKHWRAGQSFERALPRETFGRQLTNVLGLERKTEAPRALRGDLGDKDRRKPGYVVGDAEAFKRTIARLAGIADD